MTQAQIIRDALLRLAHARREGGSFCPSEAARLVSDDWRSLMPRVREVAAELINEGKLLCTQGGAPAHPLVTKGAIRLAAPHE